MKLPKAISAKKVSERSVEWSFIRLGGNEWRLVMLEHLDFRDIRDQTGIFL